MNLWNFYSFQEEVQIYDTSTPAITLAELRSHDTSQLAQDLAESLKREKKQKSRVQELMISLEKISKNSDIRHRQSAEFVNDLKRANWWVFLVKAIGHKSDQTIN